MAKTYIEQLIVETFPEDPVVALAVAKAESGLHPRATNATDNHKVCRGSYGIYQVGCIHGSSVENLYNVEYNIKKAREIYDERKARTGNGWLAWGAYTNGSYKKYLAYGG